MLIKFWNLYWTIFLNLSFPSVEPKVTEILNSAKQEVCSTDKC